MEDNKYYSGGQDANKQYMQPGQGRKKSKAWVWIVLAAVIVCAAAVVLVIGKADGAGNAGVIALYEYYRDKQESFDSAMGDSQKEIGERLMKEPFEIEAEMNVKADMLTSYLKNFGASFETVTIDIDAKYDMKDLGIKMEALMGFVNFGAYVIEDEIVVELFGQAGSMPVELPIEADLGDEMTLEERGKAFLPFLPEDDELILDVLHEVALSVPDEYTEAYEDDIYSPMDDDDVKMNVITTTLDADAMREVAENFEENMKNNDALTEEIQDAIDEFTNFFDLDGFDLEQEMDEMVDESEDIPEMEITWSVYERNGAYVGVHIYIENEDMEVFEYTEMCEFSEQEVWISAKVSSDDENVNRATHIIFDGNQIEFANKIDVENDVSIRMLLEGEVEVENKDADEYSMTMALSCDIEGLNMESITIDELEQDELSFEIEIEAACLFGDDLETLEDSRDWDDIYEKEWGDLEDIFSGGGVVSGLI